MSEELRQTKERVLAERHRAERQAKQGSKSAAQAPQITHHDSGGGSEQFRQAGGDNSIVEYGQEANTKERDEAAESLHAYLDSIAAHRWVAACTYMTTGLAAGMQRFAARFSERQGLDGCPEILAALNEHSPQSALDAAARADVASLRVQGDRAMVIYRGAGGEGYVMPMMREEGEWRVSAPAGTPAL